jgi:hypothetical protein
MKNLFKFSLLASLLLLPISSAQAVSYKLTITETYNIAEYMYSAEDYVAKLDSGESTCKDILMLISAVYKEESIDPFYYEKKATVKNESGKTIAVVPLKSKYKRVSDYECAFTSTVTLPKAKYYSFYAGSVYKAKPGTFLIIESVPFSVFKKNKATISLFDYQP